MSMFSTSIRTLVHSRVFSVPTIAAQLLFTATVLAAPGAPLATFGSAGRVHLNAILPDTPGDVSVGHLVIQNDGALLVIGSQVANTVGSSIVARLRDDGSLDTSYGNGGIASEGAGDGLLLSDGGLIVVRSEGGNGALSVAKLTTSGQLDVTFGTNGRSANVLGGRNLLLEANGKILTGTGTVLSRVNQTGQPEASLNSLVSIQIPGGVGPKGMAADVDGSIVLAGIDVFDGDTFLRVLRLLPNGAPDSTFGVGGIQDILLQSPFVSGEISSVVIDPMHRVLIAAEADMSCASGICAVLAVARLLRTGEMDTTFGVAGFTTVPGVAIYGANVALQPDGKILVAGNGRFSSGLTKTQVFVARFTDGGQLDPTFASTGIAQRDVAPDNSPNSGDVRNAIVVSPTGVIFATSNSAPGNVRGASSVFTFLANDANDDGVPESWDLAPVPLPFATITGAQPDTLTESAPATVSGLGNEISVPIIAEQGEVAVNGGTYTSWSWIRNGDQVRLRRRSSAAPGANATINAVAGGMLSRNNARVAIGAVASSLFAVVTREAPSITGGGGVFSVPENAAIATLVATITSSSPGGGAIAFAFTAGNTGNAFSIDANGRVTVAAPLDFETRASFALTVEARDAGGLASTATVTVNVTDVSEAQPGSSSSGGNSGGGGSLDLLALALLLLAIVIRSSGRSKQSGYPMTKSDGTEPASSRLFTGCDLA